MTDPDLVKACLSGDPGAWESIVRQHHRRIYNLAYRFTGRFDEAEDLTQEIFLKIYRTLSSYRPESGMLNSWIVQVGRNHIVDHYRKFKVQRAQTDSLETEYDRVNENPARYLNPGEALERLELQERVRRALLKVPEDLRDAVILRDLEEFTYEEIADMLNLPLGTVKSRINRGRIELARLLKRSSL
jgi:RNA polymerase sigma-70 factor (ECF subfamily)